MLDLNSVITQYVAAHMDELFRVGHGLDQVLGEVERLSIFPLIFMLLLGGLTPSVNKHLGIVCSLFFATCALSMIFLGAIMTSNVMANYVIETRLSSSPVKIEMASSLLSEKKELQKRLREEDEASSPTRRLGACLGDAVSAKDKVSLEEAYAACLGSLAADPGASRRATEERFERVSAALDHLLREGAKNTEVSIRTAL